MLVKLRIAHLPQTEQRTLPVSCWNLHPSPVLPLGALGEPRS